MRAELTAIVSTQDEEPSWAEIQPAPAPATRTIVAEPAARRITPNGASEPSIAAVTGWTLAVVALAVGAAMALRRLLRRSGLLAGGSLITVLARRALGPRQDLFLVEVGPRLFLIGATRDRLAALGELSRPDEVAQVRARGASEGGAEGEFRAALRESLRDADRTRASAESPAGNPFAGIAGEIADIRKTIEAWRT